MSRIQDQLTLSSALNAASVDQKNANCEYCLDFYIYYFRYLKSRRRSTVARLDNLIHRVALLRETTVISLCVYSSHVSAN